MPKFGLIGYPISHSLSPLLFRKACGGVYDYDLIETGDFEKAMEVFLSQDYFAINVTAPFKQSAAAVSDIKSDYVQSSLSANILIKGANVIKAYNSDVYAVRKILRQEGLPARVLVIGNGGAGKSARCAALSLGLDCSVCNRTTNGAGYPVHPLSDIHSLAAESDFVIYTLPLPIDEAEALRGKTILEANYLSPSLESLAGRYIGGREWLNLQAEKGFEIMLGELNNSRKK